MGKRGYLSWIDDDSLMDATKHVYTKLKEGLAKTSLKELQNNIIDPFTLLFETAFRNLSLDDWLQSEIQRQAQKKLSNAIGDFHQKVLGACDGWEDLGNGHESGVDIRKTDDTIYAEIKNKFNTISGSKLPSAHQQLINLASKHQNRTVYMVRIIANTSRTSIDEVWNRKGTSNERVRLISGDRFYALVTGEDNALQQLYQKLPAVIGDLLAIENPINPEDSTALLELNNQLGGNQISDRLWYFFKGAFPTTEDF